MDSTQGSDPIGEEELIRRISQEITEVSGIEFGESQYEFVHSRLVKRMRTLEIHEPHSYWAYFMENKGKEIPRLVSLLTTHHTFFFREYPQFEFLLQTALPALIVQLKTEGRTHLKIWSAGCSHGQEVYSLSMFLHAHLPRLAPGFTYDILGSDICGESIAVAKNGVYHWDSLKEIPSLYLDGNWVAGKASVADYAKVKPEIKTPCSFELINLKSTDSALGARVFDLILCRNVFIYFTTQRIKAITASMLKHLSPQGFLFLGVSESLMGLELPISSLGLSVYRHAQAPRLDSSKGASRKSGLLRVLCVDDSPTVLKLLKHILTASFGFEVVGTACDGKQAAEFLKSNKVDIVTLDLHMPEQNGVEYLRHNFNPAHPPVVIVSSVAREDADLAHTALSLGASDYIEKPALDGLVQRGDEMRAKLNSAYQTRQRPVPNTTEKSEKTDHFFQKNYRLESVELKLRMIIAGPGNQNELQYVLADLKGLQPPVVVLWVGPENLFPPFKQRIHPPQLQVCNLSRGDQQSLQNSTVYVGQLSKDFEWLRERNPDLQISMMVLEVLGEKDFAQIRTWPNAHFILRDLEGAGLERYRKMRQVANEVVPHTSFIYTSDFFFNRTFVQEGLRSVVLAAFEPAVFENSEVIKILSDEEAIICLFHTRKSMGGVLVVPEKILKQDSLLLEQNVKKLIRMMKTTGDNLRAKVVGSADMLKKVIDILSEEKISVSFSREMPAAPLEAYYFTDSGRLRLPKVSPATALGSTSPTRASVEARLKTKVLIVDDSKVVRELLRRIIEDDPTMEVVAQAERPSQVASLIEKHRPDVMTLDLEMPEMSGVELLKQLMPRFQIPTIIISSVSLSEGRLVIQALEWGALDYIEKPQMADLAHLAPQIREKIKMVATATPQWSGALTSPQSLKVSATLDTNVLIAIGASTGGTVAIKSILSQLPENIPPIVIAQHIPANFSRAFAQQLNEACRFEVKEAEFGDVVRPGLVLVAPGGKQTTIVRQRDELRIQVKSSEALQIHQPSVDVMFSSVAQTVGSRAIGILLTGMGKDGAEGLLKMREQGARTIAQDRASCAVFGMPKAAIELGAAEATHPLRHIPEALLALLKRKNRESA